MRNGLSASTLLIGGLFAAASLLAQKAASPPAASAQSIPDLSGIWERPSDLNPVFASGGRSDLCDEPACQALLKIRPGQLIVTVEEPQMLPWAEDRFRASRREGSQGPDATRREDANPWFSACQPFSPTAITLSPFAAIELRQFPDVVILFFAAQDGSHAVRRVYVDGRGHPSSVKPTWMGHSIGKYEGGALIVDTIGFKGDRWLDPQGHPHSDALHLTERIRRMDQNSLEYEVTITDPTAYRNSWRKKGVRALAPPGPRIWDSVICEELLQMGTHYGAEAVK